MSCARGRKTANPLPRVFRALAGSLAADASCFQDQQVAFSGLLDALGDALMSRSPQGVSSGELSGETLRDEPPVDEWHGSPIVASRSCDTVRLDEVDEPFDAVQVS